MAFTDFPNFCGPILSAIPFMPFYGVTSASAAIDAVGESFACIGRVKLTTGPGTSKTISSAGGTVHINISTLTFANAGTTVKVGVQDVSSGIEDGTYDVRADVVGGSGGLTSGVCSVPMTTGTKTITHDDLVAVVFEMTARGGADTVTFLRYGTTGNAFPYTTLDVGSGPARATLYGLMTLEFDDGTLGYFNSDVFAFNPSTPSFASNSTPDEYALVFQVPVPMRVTSLVTTIGSFANTDDFELILYSDPLGTPVAERTIAHDADESNAQSVGQFERDISPYDLSAGTTYAIAMRPTTTNALAISVADFGSGNANLRGATLFGTNASLGTRTDQSGAFTETTTQIPLMGFRASFDDGGSGSAAEVSHVFVG
jgi:hypothetical protein